MAAAVQVLMDRFPGIIANLAGNTGADQAAQEITTIAQGLAPVLTGTLRDSIHSAPMGPNAYEISTDVRYAVYVETGSGYGPAQPYMAPAAHQGEPILLAKVQESITSGL